MSQNFKHRKIPFFAFDNKVDSFHHAVTFHQHVYTYPFLYSKINLNRYRTMSFGKHFKLLSALSLVSFHFPSWPFLQFCKLHIFLGSLSHNNSQIKSTSVYTHLLKENYIPNFMFPSGNHIQQVTKNLIHFFIILSEMSEEEYKNENTLHYKADTSHSVC